MNIPVAPNSTATEWVVPEWIDQRWATILVDHSHVCVREWIFRE
jgi:hypothetical protein